MTDLEGKQCASNWMRQIAPQSYLTVWNMSSGDKMQMVILIKCVILQNLAVLYLAETLFPYLP